VTIIGNEKRDRQSGGGDGAADGAGVAWQRATSRRVAYRGMAPRHRGAPALARIARCRTVPQKHGARVKIKWWRNNLIDVAKAA
jgi:hypothetical protein